MNVDNHAVSLFAVDLANRISMANLCAIAIRSHSIFAGSDLIRDLCGKNRPDRAVLVQYSQGLPVNLDDTSNGGSTA